MNGYAADKLLFMFSFKHCSYIYICVYVKESVVFLLVGLSGITRNSSPVCVSIIEAVMTDRNWREDPGYPV